MAVLAGRRSVRSRFLKTSTNSRYEDSWVVKNEDYKLPYLFKTKIAFPKLIKTEDSPHNQAKEDHIIFREPLVLIRF